MRNGFKIVDTDTHMMEPSWLWERHIEDAFKGREPQMGIAPDSGRKTFLVEGESFTREKGKYPMAAPAFLEAAGQGDGALRARACRPLQRQEPASGYG